MSLLTRYPDSVAEFALPNFSLRNDLEQLTIVYQHRVPEATVFYAGRILEALSGAAVTALGGKAKANVFANLEYIDDFHFFDPVTRYWAHALRRMGNQVRHILAPLEMDAHHVAMALLDTWLEWYFVHFPLGPQMKDFHSQSSANADILALFFELTRQLKTTNFDPQLFNQQHQEVLLHPTMVAVLIEKCLDSKNFALADQLIEQANQRAENDLRLLQLKGLSLSRQGQLQPACQVLSQLNKQFPNDDETMGILGGVHKRLWSESDDQAHLKRAGKLYHQGWKNSKQRNTYLGINAASIKLWQHEPEQAQTIARAIVEQFDHKQAVLREKFPEQTFEFNFWDLETKAQATLLAGNDSAALQLYTELLDPKRHPNKPYSVVTDQLKQHFKYLTPPPALIDLVNSVVE
ncbi:MAG: hypothetical protein HWE13_06135 [Gammaproteobacteria bacterium]|nr:hypothetical protein [Gammaproteobacteria bacterium]NVK87683.1 hypothetical protein [Gammaproteobacteria bacterium]